MSKSLTITADIQSMIRNALGDPNADTSNLVVFEASFVNTKPLNKRGGLFKKATLTRATLQEMADFLASGNSIHLHTLHQQGWELPVGKVFSAKVADLTDGTAELRGLFYLPKSETDLINRIENAVIDEVSVGFQSKSILCSECGWDYLGEDATYINILDETCANDHVIGEDGVHTVLAGLDTWFELSLVSIGAAKDAKIVPLNKSLFNQGSLERLAASGIPLEASVVRASFSVEKPKGETHMQTELQTVLSALTEKTSEAATLSVQLTQSKADVDRLSAELAAANAEIVSLKAAVPAGVAEIQASLDEVQANLTAVSDALAEHYKAALTAASKEVPKDLPGAAEMLSAIKETGVKLHQLIGSEGTAVTASATESKPEKPVGNRRASFKTLR